MSVDKDSNQALAFYACWIRQHERFYLDLCYVISTKISCSGPNVYTNIATCFFTNTLKYGNQLVDTFVNTEDSDLLSMT